MQDVNKKKTTLSYPKYLVECRLGRKLDPNLETIDHIDGDFNNNDPENLRLVDRSTHAKQDSLVYKEEHFICPICSNTFKFTKLQIRELSARRKAGYITGPFCSRECTGIYGAGIKSGKLIQSDFVNNYIPSKSKDKNLLKIEPFIRNNKSGVGDIGETLTDNADGNTEGTSVDELRRD